MFIFRINFLVVFLLKVHISLSTLSLDRVTTFDRVLFKNNWCRQRKAAYDWEAMLKPCERDMEYKNGSRSDTLVERTSYEKSVVRNTRIRPASEYTSIWIESRDSLGQPKLYGGDSWRVVARGSLATIAADVFDYNNGSYEAIFLPMEAGRYALDIRLDYTLCDGLRNPPVDWFYQVHCSGVLKNQEDIGTELFSDMRDYINKRINNQLIEINVPFSQVDPTSLAQIMVEAEKECKIPCKKLWDGYGRWNSNTKWTPFLEQYNLKTSTGQSDMFADQFDLSSRHLKQNGVFWIYGDSLSYYFFESFSKRDDFCHYTFRLCNVSYNWIYPKTLYQLTETCDETKLEVHKIIYYLSQVTNHPRMDENSALLFNAGAHYVKTASFGEYQKAIKEMSRVLSKEFKGKPIWKSTAAIHDQTATVMGSFRRFTTDHRVKLFNAYSNGVMCGAGITSLDIYPISASYPLGTKDGIHYLNEVFMPVEELLVNYFNT